MAAEHNYEWQQQPATSDREATAIPAGTAITMQNVDSLRSWQPRFSRASISDDAGASPQRILMYRVGICCVAVGLLWLTTLDMSTAIADAHFKSISLNAVVTSWERSIEVIRMEEESYELCSNREIYECNQAFNASLLELDSTLATKSDENVVIVNTASTTASYCSGTYREVAQSLLAYQRAGHDIPYKTVDSSPDDYCTDSEIQQVEDMLGDASAQTDYAYTLSSDYKRSTGDLFLKAGDSVYNYTAYNANYLDEKTGSINTDLGAITALSVPGLAGIANAFEPVSKAADTFVSCTLRKQCTTGQTPAADQCCANPTMAEAYDALVVSLEEEYQTAVANYNNTKISLTAQYNAVASQLTSAFNFIDAITPYWASIKSSVPEFPSDLTIPGIDLPEDIYFPFGALPGLIDVPQLTSFFGGYQGLYNTMNDTITEAGDNIEDAATGWAASIGNITTGITLFDDYDPPEVYDPTDDFEANSDAFLSSQAAALGAIYTAPSDDGFSANETLAYLVSSIVPPSPINITVSGFSTENYSFYNFYDVLSVISFGAVFLDYSWRVFYSLQMIVRYWSTSAVGLPTVDVRQFKTTQKTPAMVIISRVLTSPYVLYTGLLFAFILGIATLLSAYLPIYYKFQNGCVKSHDGTLLSNNADSFAYNWASLSGAENIAQGLKSYDSRRNSECAGYTNKANNDYTTFQTAWNNADISRQGTAAKVNQIARCINTDTTGIIFAPGIYEFIIKDENGVSYTHPKTLFEETLCNTPAPPLVSLTFNCTDYLPECAVGCNGPSPLLIRYTTHQSSCASEDLVHSALLKLFTGIIIYICLNISRIAFTKGLSMVFWRSITPFGFNFVGSCSRAGKMTVNAKTLLQAETAIMIGKFRIQAAGLIIFAGLIQLPWLFMLVYVR